MIGKNLDLDTEVLLLQKKSTQDGHILFILPLFYTEGGSGSMASILLTDSPCQVTTPQVRRGLWFSGM